MRPYLELGNDLERFIYGIATKPISDNTKRNTAAHNEFLARVRRATETAMFMLGQIEDDKIDARCKLEQQALEARVRETEEECCYRVDNNREDVEDPFFLPPPSVCKAFHCASSKHDDKRANLFSPVANAEWTCDLIPIKNPARYIGKLYGARCSLGTRPGTSF